MSGKSGDNRGPASQRRQIRADTDWDAVQEFLVQKGKSAGTQRLYAKEAERLMLWAVLERGKPLSSLTLTDLQAYREFLQNPQPAARWCGPKAPRESPNWRPFVGPLGDSAVNTSLAALNSLFTWLCNAGYLAGNPMGLLGRKPKTTTDKDSAKVQRYLGEESWLAVTTALDNLPTATRAEEAFAERARFVCAFMYLLAPRAGEMETHCMGSFFEERNHWYWHVVGKGSKEASLPVPDDMFDALRRYRLFLGLPSVPRQGETTPLVLSLSTMLRALQAKDGTLPAPRGAASNWRPPKPLAIVSTARHLTARQLNRVLKALFEQAVAHLPSEYADKAVQLQQASAHWLRHTSITAKVDAGMDVRYVQKDARHSDIRTTQRYIHEDRERWHEEAQKLRLPSSRKT